MAMTPPAGSLTDFTNCHASIVEYLDPLGEMNTLLAAARLARERASATVEVFEHMIVNHHEEEERELFPAVCKAATVGPERDQVVTMTQRLAADHRQIEAHWKAIRPGLERIAAGDTEALDLEAVLRLVTGYQTHAHFEETRFLPLASRILQRHDPELAQLGYALHIRRGMKRTPAFT